MRLYVLVGLPGAGKTTWVERHAKPALSSDTLRALLNGDAASQKRNGLVFAQLRALAGARLAAGCEETWVDSTALTRAERRPWIRLAELHGCPAEALFFDTPEEICRARNLARQRRVPEAVLRRMARRLSAPAIAEGFARVRVIRG